MKYARLGVNIKDASLQSREEIPNGTEFTCVNISCTCVYFLRISTKIENAFYRRTGDTHDSCCTISQYETIRIPESNAISVTNPVIRRSQWNRNIVNSLSQLYDYYSNFDENARLSEINSRLKSNFIIDEKNHIAVDDLQTYLVKFKTKMYIGNEEENRFQIKGECGQYKVTFNFQNKETFWGIVDNVLKLENGFKGYDMFYLGNLNFYEESNTYFLHSATHNFEILLDD